MVMQKFCFWREEGGVVNKLHYGLYENGEIIISL